MKPPGKFSASVDACALVAEHADSHRHFPGSPQLLIRPRPRPVYISHREDTRMTCTAPSPSPHPTVRNRRGARRRFEWDGTRASICF